MDSIYANLALSGPDSFRLLYIPAKNSTNTAQFRLENKILQDGDKYEALSYVWGSAQRTVQISVNNSSLNITSDLFAILDTIKLPNEVRVLWIDQICINQDDVNERNSQVLLMSRIYSSARRTLVWLSKDNERALRLIRSMVPLLLSESAPSMSQIISPWLRPASFMRAIKPFTSPRLLLDSMNPMLVREMFRLLQSPWFSRTWILQELIMAEAALVLCGKEELPWSDLYTYCSMYCRSPSNRMFLLCLDIGDLRKQRATDAETHSLHLLSLLQNRRWARASDPRDKIYAMLGIANDITTKDITPDYSKSVREVYTETIAKIIQITRATNILSFVQTCPEQSLPSWVPDWSTDSEASRLTDLNKFPKLYYPRQMDVVGDKLIISGVETVIIEKVEKISTGFTDRGHFHAIQPYWTKPYPISGEPFEEAYVSAISPSQYHERIDRAKSKYDYTKSLKSYLKQKTYELEGSTLKPKQRFTTCSPNHKEKWHEFHAFIVAEHGFMGIAPETARPGDVICILSHSTILHVLRRARDNPEAYEYIGECIVYGLMDGEALDEETEWQNFTLV